MKKNEQKLYNNVILNELHIYSMTFYHIFFNMLIIR